MALLKYGRNKKLQGTKKEFSTGSGVLKTEYEAEIHFTLPEFSATKVINWKFQLTDNEDLGYDFIIGRDLMSKLGIDISFEKEMITWEGTEVPMRDYRKLKRQSLSKYEIKAIIQSSNE